MTIVRSTQAGAEPQLAATHAEWGSFLLLGVVLMLGGLIAISLPVLSTATAGLVLGGAFIAVGIVKVGQSWRLKRWTGLLWHELTGAIEIIGGLMIYLNPIKGAFAVAMFLALTFLLQGLGHTVLAFKVRSQPGARWLLVSGLTSLATSVALLLKLRFFRDYAPGEIVGLSLIVSGLSYVMMALALRRAKGRERLGQPIKLGTAPTGGDG